MKDTELTDELRKASGQTDAITDAGQLKSLIAAMGRKNAATHPVAAGASIFAPKGAVDATSKLKKENEILKAQLEQLLKIESDLGAKQVIEGLTAKYSDFDPEAICERMLAIAADVAERYEQAGLNSEEAVEKAEECTRMMWDNPQGIENLHLLARLSAKGAEVKEALTPDPHITGSSAAMPPKSWKDRVKSTDSHERDSVFNDLF